MTAGEADSPNRERTRGQPLVALGLVIICWGAGPVIAKLITVPPLLAVLVRFGLSFPVLFILVALRGGRVTVPLLTTTALPGISFGINLVFVFATLQEATVAVLSVAIALQPGLLLLVVGPIFAEWPGRSQVLLTLVGVAGAAVVILGAGAGLRTSPLGLLLALTALVTFSVYFVLTRRARSVDDVDPVTWMAGINLWAFLAAVPPALLWLDVDDLGRIDRSDLLWLLVLSYVTGIVGHVLMSWIHGYVEVARSSLYLLAVNVVAVGLAWPVHNEPVTALQVVGGVVVLSSVAAVLRSSSGQRRRPEDLVESPSRSSLGT